LKPEPEKPPIGSVSPTEEHSSVTDILVEIRPVHADHTDLNILSFRRRRMHEPRIPFQRRRNDPTIGKFHRQPIARHLDSLALRSMQLTFSKESRLNVPVVRMPHTIAAERGRMPLLRLI
jgi:hypothetical protein